MQTCTVAPLLACTSNRFDCVEQFLLHQVCVGKLRTCLVADLFTPKIVYGSSMSPQVEHILPLVSCLLHLDQFLRRHVV